MTDLPDRLVPFSTHCTSCRRITHGMVRTWLCLDGGSPYAHKVTGLIMHDCEHCGAHLGSIMRAAGGKADVLETGDGPQMSLMAMAAIIGAKERGAAPAPLPSHSRRRGWITRFLDRFRR